MGATLSPCGCGARLRRLCEARASHDDALLCSKAPRPMNLHLSLAPLISLVAGILILVMPKLLNFIVAIYLILIGLVGLFGASSLRLS